MAIIAVHIFAILLLLARGLWETEFQRDLEEELIFRGNQYVTAIELFQKKNSNLSPQNLDVLVEKKFLRRRFTDPMSASGKWNIVLDSGKPGEKTLLLVPEEMVGEGNVTQKLGMPSARIVGVCSSSCEEGFREYRKKKKYCEWAFYVGQKLDQEMPTLDVYGQESDRKSSESPRSSESSRSEESSRSSESSRSKD